MGRKGNRCQTEYDAATWRTKWRLQRSAVSGCFSSCYYVAEDVTPTTQECGATEFRCADGGCIESQLRCDGAFDCWDESDELDCGIGLRYFSADRLPSKHFC